MCAEPYKLDLPFDNNGIRCADLKPVDHIGIWRSTSITGIVPAAKATQLQHPRIQTDGPLVADHPNLSAPKYPQYAILSNRLESFQTWPVGLKQRPADLSQAGLYYMGISDHTACFCCGGGIKNWVEADIPWEEHARWYPGCDYLKLQKGEEFIQTVQNKYFASGSSSSTASTTLAVSTTIAETKNEPIAGSSQGQEYPPNERTLCKICLTNEIAVVFLPCSHFVACLDCAPAITICAVCRKPIEKWLKVYY